RWPVLPAAAGCQAGAEDLAVLLVDAPLLTCKAVRRRIANGNKASLRGHESALALSAVGRTPPLSQPLRSWRENPSRHIPAPADEGSSSPNAKCCHRRFAHQPAQKSHTRCLPPRKGLATCGHKPS